MTGVCCRLGGRAGRNSRMRGWPSWGTTCGSITARIATKGLSLSRRTRLGLRAHDARRGRRMPSGRRSTGRLPHATARRSRTDPRSRLRRSQRSSRRSPGGI